MSLDIPGTPIRPSDKPGSKRCPSCGRSYDKTIVKKQGDQITYLCPYCRKPVKTSELSLARPKPKPKRKADKTIQPQLPSQQLNEWAEIAAMLVDLEIAFQSYRSRNFRSKSAVQSEMLHEIINKCHTCGLRLSRVVLARNTRFGSVWRSLLEQLKQIETVSYAILDRTDKMRGTRQLYDEELTTELYRLNSQIVGSLHLVSEARRDIAMQMDSLRSSQTTMSVEGRLEPRVWLYMATGDDKHQTDLLTERDQIIWGANPNTVAGDIVLMYRTTPYSDIAYLFRAKTDAREAKRTRTWKWDNAIDLGDKVTLERPVTLAEIRAHPRLADWSLARSPQGAMRRKQDVREEGYWKSLRGLLIARNPPLAESLANWEGVSKDALWAEAYNTAKVMVDPDDRQVAISGMISFLPESMGQEAQELVRVTPYLAEVLDIPLVRQSGGVDVRAQNHFDNPVVDRLAIGERLTVLDRARGSDAPVWLRVKTPRKIEGFIPEQLSNELLISHVEPDNPPVGDIIQERYQVRQVMTQWELGGLYLVEDLKREGPLCVAKLILSTDRVQKLYPHQVEQLAKLAHPHLCRFTDFFLEGRYWCLVMEGINGETLAKLNAGQKLIGWNQAVTWTLQIADVLAYMHSQQPKPLVHGDVHPKNVIINSEGEAVLVDIGTPGDVTPGFSPPEQYQQDKLDIRTDIYALGATLYFLLTGEAPQPSDSRTTKDLLVPVNQVNPVVAPVLSQIVQKAMALDPSQRYQTMEEFRADLDQAASALVTTGDVRPFGKCLTGMGVANQQPLRTEEIQAIRDSRVEAVKVLTLPDPDQSVEVLRQVRSIYPNAFIVCRLMAQFSVRIGPPLFVEIVGESALELYDHSVRYFEVHNEPNLPQEGLGISWANGAEFGVWFAQVVDLLHAKMPDAKFGFPGLAPQLDVPDFLDGATSTINAKADWIGVHCYWQNDGDGRWGMLSTSDGMLWKEYRDRFPNKLLMITEFSNNSASVSYEDKGRQYASYYQRLRDEPNLGAAFAFALNWPGQDANREGWVSDGQVTALPKALGALIGKPGYLDVKQHSITWLHLSDLHFRPSQANDANVVLTALLRDIRERIEQDGLRPDCIFVTNVAYSGKTGEYELAKSFFDALLATGGLSRDRLFVVPGNHDVNRELITADMQTISQSLTDRASINAFLANPDNMRQTMMPFRGYAQFANTYLHQEFDDKHYFYVRMLEAAGQRVAILGLNSAWLCSSDPNRGRLLLGKRQVRAALDAAQGADFKIALMHHPIDWLQEFDRRDSAEVLLHDCDVVLHGHESEIEVVSPDHRAMIIGSGPNVDTPQYSFLYNIVQFDLSSRIGTVYLRRYVDEHGARWVKDTISYANVPDGVYNFHLPPVISGAPGAQDEILHRLSPSAEAALHWAEGLRRLTGSATLYTEYLLIGLCQKTDGPTHNLLTLFDDEEVLRPRLEELANRMTGTRVRLQNVSPVLVESLRALSLSSNVRRALDEAVVAADKAGSASIRSRHLLVGLLAVPESVAAKWVADTLQVERKTLYSMIIKVRDMAPPLDEIRHASARYRPTCRLAYSMPNHATVGQMVQLRIELTQAPQSKNTFELPANVSELYSFVSADGLRIQGDEAASISLDSKTDRQTLEFELQAYLCGERTFTVELFAEDPDSGRVSVYQTQGHITVTAPEAVVERLPILPTLDVHVAPQPDFVLRLEQIETTLVDGEIDSCRIVYSLSSRMPGLRLHNQIVGNAVLQAAEITRLRALLNETLGRAIDYRPEDTRERLLSVGTHLFDWLFPVDDCADFRESFWQVADRLTTWLVVEDGSIWLPWELLVPYREYDEAPLHFLCERYRLSRWVAGLGPPLYNELPLGEIALAHYRALEAGQEDEELLAWRRLLNAPGASGILQVARPETPFYELHLLRQAKQIVAKRDIVARDNAPSVSSPEEEARRARLDLRLKRPVVTLSILDGELSGFGADAVDWLLPERVLPFLRGGASAIVGPWWPTSEAADRIFWTTFYDLLSRRVPLGETVWRARRAVQLAIPHRPDWLAYTLFGDPRAQSYWPEPSEGYTVLECLDHEPDNKFRVGKTYHFRASIRTRPPVWYQDQLVRPEEFPQDPRAVFMVPGLQTTSEPIEMKPLGRTMVQAPFSLTPTQAGEFPLIVRLLDGEERLQSLQLQLVVEKPV